MFTALFWGLFHIPNFCFYAVLASYRGNRWPWEPLDLALLEKENED